MKYSVVFTERAKKTLKKMDKHTSALIISWIEKNLQSCDNPRVHGKALVANRNGQWRYRIGNYRALCQINNNEVIILVLEIGHRRNVYK